MKNGVWAILLFSSFAMSADLTPFPPTVRDAYVQQQGTLSRTVRLKDSLNVVVCKAAYDAWAQTQNGTPSFSLYIDGRLMKGLEPAKPNLVVGPASDEDQETKNVNQACAKAAADGFAPLEKDSTDKAAAAKDAAEKAVAETDAGKKAALVKDAADKASAARTAQEKAAAAKSTADLAGTARYLLTFYLDPQFVAKVDTKEPWLRLLERPWDGRQVAVSVATEGGSPWPSVAKIGINRLNLWWLACWAALFVLAIVLFVKFARSSDIIRDTGPNLAAPAGGAAPKKAYSLARTQMAVWTFLVAGALAFIFLVTWNENTLSAGILGLIGISFGTTLLAATADGTQAPQATQGFLTDLLSEGTGPSFHRYQMVLFTAILAAIFVVKTASGLVMPEFDATLLGLMGISSGTYIGFKLQGR
jgi:hypothetical protein